MAEDEASHLANHRNGLNNKLCRGFDNDVDRNSGQLLDKPLTNQKKLSLRLILREGDNHTGNEDRKISTTQESGKLHDIHSRKSLPQSEFNELFRLNRPPRKTIKKKVGKGVQSCSDCCSPKGVWSVVKKRIPILDWLPKYNVKENLVADLIGGVTVGIMHIPQSMAYAMLGNIPPVVGMYVSFFSVLVYFALGTSRHLSIGTFSVITLMIGQAVNARMSDFYHPPIDPLTNMTIPRQNLTRLPGEKFDLYDNTRIQIAAALCFLVAIYQIAFAFLQVGTLAVYLSDNMVSGFTTSAAFHVFTSQVPSLIGVSIVTHGGVFKLIYDWIDIIKAAKNFNWLTCVISVTCIFGLIVVNDFINERYRSKMIMPIPMELIVIIIYTCASYFGELNQDYHVKIVKYIPTGLPIPTFPRVDMITSQFGSALTIAVVSYCIPISLAKIFAMRHKYEIDPTQEMFAYGASNLVGCFFSCFPCCASLSRSCVQELSGAKTQLCSCVTATLLIIVLLWVGPLFEPIPHAILASIIVVALRKLFKQVVDFKKAWDTAPSEALVWGSTFLAVIFLDVDLGLIVGISVSVFVFLVHAHRPYVGLMGIVPGSDTFLDLKKFQSAKEVDGVKIIHFGGSIYFGNREYFRSSIYRLTGINPQALISKARKYNFVQMNPIDLNAEKPPLPPPENENVVPQVVISIPNNHEESTENHSHANGNDHHVVQTEDNLANGNANKKTETRKNKTNNTIEKRPYVIPILGIVIDCSAVGFTDMSALSILRGLIQEYNEIGVSLYLAACQDHLIERLEKTEHYNTVQCLIFPTVADAVSHIYQNHKIMVESNSLTKL